MILFKATIFGRPIVKKNTQRIVGYGKFKRAIYSPQFLAWERAAVFHIKLANVDRNTINQPIEAHYRFYFKDRQGEADTSNLVEGVSDALQKAEVILDDKLIYVLHASKHFGEEPRVEVELIELEAG